MKKIILCALLGLTSQAWGWGSYGHQQVNRAAVLLLQQSGNQPVAECFQKNLTFIQRLSITPDYDWKNLSTKPGDYIKQKYGPNLTADQKALAKELTRQRYLADRKEHPLHYFEVDAFIPGEKITEQQIRALPNWPFRDAFGSDANGLYPKLFKKNIAKVEAINPEKLAPDVEAPKKIDRENPMPVPVATANGTAPWRISQLYDLAVKNLQAGDFKLAMMYLGAMGHYVGDMAQPFHSSLNFDGFYFDKRFYSGADGNFSPAAGIHHSFEGAILECEYAKDLKSGDFETIKSVNADFCESYIVFAAEKAKEKGKTPKAPSDAKKQCVASRKLRPNSVNHLWLKFDSTESDVLAKAMPHSDALKAPPIPPDKVVAEVLTLASTGFWLIDPLLKKFAEVTADPEPEKTSDNHDEEAGKTIVAKADGKDKIEGEDDDDDDDDDQAEEGNKAQAPIAPSPNVKVPSARSISIRKMRVFAETKIVNDETAAKIAHQRMADAAVLLARLWLSAMSQPGVKKESIPVACQTFPENNMGAPGYDKYEDFLKLVLLKNYPKPDYIPPVGRKPAKVSTALKKKPKKVEK